MQSHQLFPDVKHPEKTPFHSLCSLLNLLSNYSLAVTPFLCRHGTVTCPEAPTFSHGSPSNREAMLLITRLVAL